MSLGFGSCPSSSALVAPFRQPSGKRRFGPPLWVASPLLRRRCSKIWRLNPRVGQRGWNCSGSISSWIPVITPGFWRRTRRPICVLTLGRPCGTGFRTHATASRTSSPPHAPGPAWRKQATGTAPFPPPGSPPTWSRPPRSSARWSAGASPPCRPRPGPTWRQSIDLTPLGVAGGATWPPRPRPWRRRWGRCGSAPLQSRRCGPRRRARPRTAPAGGAGGSPGASRRWRSGR
mmetsp:Transcript_56812/g.151630  ORF Transcript_56812/g.151630 Transcript_56812/m.151630 type:complete len:232 (+) Transcript_56812:1115-1810(+)